MTGALLLGSVADVVGRLKTLMMALLGLIGFEGFSAFAPTFMVMVILRYVFRSYLVYDAVLQGAPS